MSERAKNCYCHTCGKPLHSLGLASHRAMHRNKGENCRIENSHGEISKYKFAAVEADNKRSLEGYPHAEAN